MAATESQTTPYGHEQFNQTPTDTTYRIGDLARTYEFGTQRLSTLGIDDSPMFTFLSIVTFLVYLTNLTG